MTIHAENFKGHTINIHHDCDTECPIDKYNNNIESCVIVCIWQRNSTLSDLNPFADIVEAKRYAKRMGYEWFYIGAYSHGNVGYTTKHVNQYPYNCPFDSGVAGVVLVKKSDFPQHKKTNKTRRLDISDSCVSQLAEWCNGECYGFIIEDSDGQEVESCWGFIGFEQVIQGAKESIQ